METLPGDRTETSEIEESAPASEPEISPEEKREALVLLFSIFVIAACGLTYELLIATVSSYLLGSSVTQFSLSIGVFVGSMGVGSHWSQKIRGNLLGKFILLELMLAALGGASVAILFFAYGYGSAYWLALYGSLFAIGAMTGLELPLLTRLLKPYGSFRTVIAQALSFDYIGALIGAVLFPLLLLPSLGMMRSALLIGLINLSVALWNAHAFRHRLKSFKPVTAIGLLVGATLIGGFVFSLQVMSFLEHRLYEDEIVYTAQTPYQRIIMTRWREDFRLFIDGNLQFASPDEYRYHEALIHPAMSLSPSVQNVLVLGGGDGLGIREILKFKTVKSVTLVDLDPKMTELGKTYPALVKINNASLKDPRVKIVNIDAHKFLETDSTLYDVIIADLPDPNSDVLAKLYSVEFYKLAFRRLAASGFFVTQATSPYFAREAFWCIAKTVEEAGFSIAPYHAYVPSFGDWGFVLASPHAIPLDRMRFEVPARFLTPEATREMFTFSKDVSEIPVDVSTLDRPAILNYYLHDWKQWE